MEIYEQSNRNIKQFHVAQELRLVNGHDLLSGLALHQKAVFDEHVKTQWLLAGEPFVFNDNRLLTDTPQAAEFKFLEQAPYIRILILAIPGRMSDSSPVC